MVSNKKQFLKGNYEKHILGRHVRSLLVLAVAASAQTFKPGVATVVRIQGEARYSLGDGNWHPLVVGKMLGAGAVIQTAHDATVDMVLGKTIEMPQAAPLPDRISPAPDANVRGMIAYKPSVEQNMVRMTGDTVLAIDKLTVGDTGVDTVSDTELDLKQGRIFASVKKLSAASQYLIKIPNGIAGVRGCVIGIDASGWCAVIKDPLEPLPTKVPCCFPSSDPMALRRRIRWMRAVSSLLRPVRFRHCRRNCSACCSRSPWRSTPCMWKSFRSPMTGRSASFRLLPVMLALAQCPRSDSQWRYGQQFLVLELI